ncbi:SRPBCC family protein [Alienimonas californiensis]|uniref:SRPBCC family protein n=1 Tax=Alienimonas californiensis TaxID=2527989 RepID=UPI0013FCF609|nr:SRPBCC family protein [Alienimonas californiensis]
MNLAAPFATVRGAASDPPRAVYDRFVAVDLPTLVAGYGPLPGAAAVKDETGTWGTVGACRTVTFTDGATATERVLSADPPTADGESSAAGRFVYRVTDYTNALRWFAHGSDGDWRFEPDGRGGTRIVWAYTFRPRGLPSAIVLWPVVRGPVRGYMKSVMRCFIADP